MDGGQVQERLSRIADSISLLKVHATGRGGVPAALQQVCLGVTQSVATVQMAGVTIIHRGTPRSLADSSSAAFRIDEAQYEVSQGPCLEAAWRRTVVSASGQEISERWPRFAGAAPVRSLRNCLALSLRLGGSDRGALNLYSEAEVAFSAFDAAAARVYVSAAESLLLALHHAEQAHRDVDGLRRAIESRTVIEQAKGIIMAVFGCSAAHAFEVLRWRSQDTNVKLRELCEQFVHEVCERPAMRHQAERISEVLLTCHARIRRAGYGAGEGQKGQPRDGPIASP